MNKDFVRAEIGSEFWEIPTSVHADSLFPEKTQWFISGTSALAYIICDMQKEARVNRVGVPSWCCSCMIQPFVDAGLDVEFYPVYVDAQGKLACDYTVVSECDATLVLSYFGYEQLRTKGRPGGIVIRDLTHSLFCQISEDARYYFGSLRKWAGFWTGGYAWKADDWTVSRQILPADPIYVQGRADAMTMKQNYLRGIIDQKDYLDLFEAAEDILDRCGILGSCERDIRCARELDAAFIKKRRRENAQVLIERLKDMVLFPEIREGDCPMFVPILCRDREQRDCLRRYLISKEIYCPVHWPVSELHKLGQQEQVLYDCSLSLVCDQRYDTTDMNRIADAIAAFNE